MTLSNEREDNHIETAIDQNKTDLTDNSTSIRMQDANKTESTKEKGNEIPDESENINDGNDATSSQNVKEESENSNETLSESNKAMSYPTSEEVIIRQHKFYIHSTWLAVQSSYFRSLFFGGMKESNSTEVHVKISESEEQAHLMLLIAMYKIDTLDNASVDELLEVLKLAHKYEVKVVFKNTKYYLQAKVVSFHICEKIMHFIKVDNTFTNVADLASTLQSFLAKTFSPLDKTWLTRSFRNLCEPSLRYLLSSDELSAVSENTIFQALMYWIEQHGIENVLESKEIPSPLSMVRFELISFDYLYNIVQHDAVAKKFPDFHSHYLRGISYHAMSNKVREALHNQPVKRKGISAMAFIPGTAFIPYTWVISKDELDVLVETDEELRSDEELETNEKLETDSKLAIVVGTNKELKSDEFWYCGYRVVLTISHVKKLDTGSYDKMETFNAKLSLEITNLKQHSVVEISWNVESKANSIYGRTNKHTFKNGTHKSMMGIEYQIEVNQSNKFKATPSLGSCFRQSSFGSAINPSTMKASKPTSVANQKRPNAPCLSIDVKMNLV